MVITLNKSFMMIAVSVAIVCIVVTITLPQDLADAKSTKKVHFTETFVSTQDPGQGHETHQIALLLSPEKGILYDGSLTYTANRNVQILILHEIDADEEKGQPTWTIDGKTIYGLSIIDTDGTSGSYEFTGAALALHSPHPETFTATASVDGWIRGGALEFITKTIEIREDPPSVDLYKSRVATVIPMHNGLYNGSQLHYIITDSSDGSLADEISQKQEWIVQTAPPLSDAPESILGEVYFFTNGIKGGGLNGFQDDVLSDTPGQPKEYSALKKAVNISWKLGQNPDILNSVDDIEQAEKNGRIEVNRTGVILNTPQIIWPDGQMPIRDGDAVDDAPYDGGQILEIDEEEDTVTFVAHRAWGPDGRTIYYIVTDSTPSGPAGAMGVTYTPTSSELVTSPAVADLYRFKNGLAGPGSLGFQPGIAAAAPGDETYTPMWRVFLVEWNGEEAGLLETVDDINHARADDLVLVSTARPMNDDHVINCPLIDPFQNLKG